VRKETLHDDLLQVTFDGGAQWPRPEQRIEALAQQELHRLAGDHQIMPETAQSRQFPRYEQRTNLALRVSVQPRKYQFLFDACDQLGTQIANPCSAYNSIPSWPDSTNSSHDPRPSSSDKVQAVNLVHGQSEVVAGELFPKPTGFYIGNGD